jgi:hypothetical protein
VPEVTIFANINAEQSGKTDVFGRRSAERKKQQ